MEVFSQDVAIEDRGGAFDLVDDYPAFQPAAARRTRSVELAPGITCHLDGDVPPMPGIAKPLVMLRFDAGETGAVLAVSGDSANMARSSSLVVVAATGIFERTFGDVPVEGRWHMPSDLRAILTAIADDPADGPVHDLYVRARALELTCQAIRHLRAATLVPHCGLDGFGEAQTHRIMKARSFIEERLHERLTLDRIARACGLNRTLLTKGFRRLFGTSVANFITDARLLRARHFLLTTDLMVATIAARCGYSNNASFSRAYIRHFGVSPTMAGAQPIALPG